MRSRHIQTPTGTMRLVEQDGALCRLSWENGMDADASELLDEAEDQIAAYFAGCLTVFDLPYRIDGSETQRRICAAISEIPFGDTQTYGGLAHKLSLPAQAIGRGCGANPLPLIVPCHRVLGSNGLGGFSGGTGIETKVALLRHEGAASLLI